MCVHVGLIGVYARVLKGERERETGQNTDTVFDYCLNKYEKPLTMDRIAFGYVHTSHHLLKTRPNASSCVHLSKSVFLRFTVAVHVPNKWIMSVIVSWMTNVYRFLLCSCFSLSLCLSVCVISVYNVHKCVACRVVWWMTFVCFSGCICQCIDCMINNYNVWNSKCVCVCVCVGLQVVTVCLFDEWLCVYVCVYVCMCVCVLKPVCIC